MTFLPFVRLWLWISAFATAAGWILSAAGQLNRAGYALLFIVFGGFVLFFRKELVSHRLATGPGGGRGSARFRRPLPLCFAVLAALVLLGGLLYAPTSFTALNYRMTRVLQWLANERWWWVHTRTSG